MNQAELLARAREEVRLARVILAAGGAAQAISRAYYGAFYAAEAALLEVGETRSKHSGVIAAFASRMVRREGLDPELGAIIKDLFRLRNEADYERATVDAPLAEAAIVSSDRFVFGVERWVTGRT
ncbi:MAG: HEPN domain-containing protein [Actinomycetota bacterium]